MIPDYVHDHLQAHPGPVRPRIVCADGYSLSVQASVFHYCSPRANDRERYGMVEIGFPERPDGSPARPRRFGKGDYGVFGWVPVTSVNEYIHDHGGLKGDPA